MTKQVTDAQEWVKVGVTGFDELLSNGIPKGSSILVSGGCGSGKTIFCLQTLWYGLTQGEKCLYVSFEESEKRLLQHMRDFGWDPEKYLANGSFKVVRLEPFDISVSIEGMIAKKKGEISIDITELGMVPKGFKPDRVVIDSISAIAAAFSGCAEGYRMYITELFRYFEDSEVTSFMISETEQNPSQYSRTGVEEFLADGVIVMYAIRQGDNITNAVEMRKLRGAGHLKKIAPLKIIPGQGIVVYPQETVFMEM